MARTPRTRRATRPDRSMAGCLRQFLTPQVWKQARRGLPKPRPDDAARALLAVESLRAAASAWVAGLAGAKLDFRIGAHFGPAIVSRLGSPTHQHITVTGDTVNAASRLLEVAKHERCRVVVTEDLIAAARSALRLGEFDESAYAPLTVAIRGRAAPLSIRMRS